jgi:hypothetical protein
MNIEYKSFKIGEEFKNLAADYWLSDEENKWLFTFKALILKYVKFGKTRSALEKKLASHVLASILAKCVRCGDAERVSMQLREDFIRFKRLECADFKCKACIQHEEQLLKEDLENTLSNFNQLKRNSVENLADSFDQETIENLTEFEIRFLQIVSDHQEFHNHDHLYRSALKNGLSNNRGFWIMRRRLVDLKLIALVKSLDKVKPYIFVHPETVNRILEVKTSSIQCILTLFNKRSVNDPDYVGEFRVLHDYLLEAGSTFSFSLMIDFSTIRLSLFDRRGSPEFIRSLLGNFKAPQGVPNERFYKNFFYAKIPLDLTVSDYSRKRKFEHTLNSRMQFTEDTNLKVAIWKRLDYLKLKVEPKYLPLVHGSTRFM